MGMFKDITAEVGNDWHEIAELWNVEQDSS